MVEFKTKNGMASLESQLKVSPQMAKLLKSHEKRVKAFIKDAKIECEHLVVDTTSILGTPVTEGNATETISRLEEVHKKLLRIFEKEAEKKAVEEEAKKAADTDFSFETIKAFAHGLIEKARSKNIGVTVIAHDAISGEFRVHGVIPEKLAAAILLEAATHEED